MQRMRERFDKIQSKNPLYSSYLCFAELVTGKNMPRRAIARHFHKLVDREDYAKNEEREIIDHLMGLSKV